MAAIHTALKSLTPIDFSTIPKDKAGLEKFLRDAFKDSQLLVDSIPIPSPDEDESAVARSRANTNASIASNSSDILPSRARPTPPPSDIESLQKQWGKPMRLNPKDNPLGMSVYKLAGKDGKGAWFGRRSVHEGLGFTKWKLGLEREFPETLKVQGEPGEGNIRGIGGERRLEYERVEGVGTLEVYHLSAKFPGPTTPRDFVTLLLTSDSALTEDAGGVTEEHGVPRHYMIVSVPCIHPEAPLRDGFIRGQYQSVEFIREVPVKKGPLRSFSSTNLLDNADSSLSREAILRNANSTSHSSKLHGEDQKVSAKKAVASDTELATSERRRSKTISFAGSRGADAKGERFDMPQDIDESESNPVEWIMLTRSDPGGSVPRFMVERGTPSSIVADASKFLDWACMQDPEDFEEPKTFDGGNELKQTLSHRRYDGSELSEVQTNGHLAGVDGSRDPPPVERFPNYSPRTERQEEESNGGIYGMVTSAASAAGSLIAAHTPASIIEQLPGQGEQNYRSNSHEETLRRYSSSTSTSSETSIGSFTSALQGDEEGDSDSINPSLETKGSQTSSTLAARAAATQQEKELAKLEERKRKLEEKLAKTKEKELSKKSEDAEKEAREIAKAEEKHAREIAKQEERYKREVAKLEAKREKEEKRLEERRRKAEEKDERTRLAREMEEMRVERDLLRKERQILRMQVMELQAENTAIAAKVGKLGPAGQEVLRGVREEVFAEKAVGERRGRASSLTASLNEKGGVNGRGSREGTPKSSLSLDR